MDDALPDFFDSQAAPPAEAAPAKPKKGQRKKRTPRPQPEQQAAPAEPKKKRGPKPGTRREKKTRAARIELSLAFHALTGLSVDEAKLVSSIATGLQATPRKSRGRIAAALGKLFA